MSANPIRDLFHLDPTVTFLNQGSFGAAPKKVMAVYQECKTSSSDNLSPISALLTKDWRLPEPTWASS